jgi:uncharacterized protein
MTVTSAASRRRLHGVETDGLQGAINTRPLPRQDTSIVTGYPRSSIGWAADASKEVTPIPPKLGNGKICYVELPAIDVARSADFYTKVFGWQTRRRGDGQVAFDDGVGEVSGTWVVGRPPSSAEPGLLLYIMVDDAAATVDAVRAHGGEIVQPIGVDAPETTARFRDPAGNVMGIYQERNN